MEYRSQLYHGMGLPIIWLVLWNMNFIFPYIGNVIIPTDEVHDFQRGRAKNHQAVIHSSVLQYIFHCFNHLRIPSTLW